MEITIFISDHCIDCKEVIQFFVDLGLEVKRINVTYDQDRFDEMVRLGGIATPFIMIGEQVFHSFDKTKIVKFLEERHG